MNERGARRPAQRIAGALLVLAAATGLISCAPDEAASLEPICQTFESSWNRLVDVRSGTEDLQIAAEARTETVADWNDLGSREGPDDVTDMINAAATNLSNAWNSTTQGGRIGHEKSLKNAGDYVATRCAETGTSVTLSELPAPLRPGAQ